MKQKRDYAEAIPLIFIETHGISESTGWILYTGLTPKISVDRSDSEIVLGQERIDVLNSEFNKGHKNCVAFKVKHVPTLSIDQFKTMQLVIENQIVVLSEAAALSFFQLEEGSIDDEKWLEKFCYVIRNSGLIELIAPQAKSTSIISESEVRSLYFDWRSGSAKKYGCQIFDEKYYLRRYRDIPDHIDPFQHFVLHGYREKREIGPDFDVIFYSKTYPTPHTIHPIHHYLKIGKSTALMPLPWIYSDFLKRNIPKGSDGSLICNVKRKLQEKESALDFIYHYSLQENDITHQNHQGNFPLDIIISFYKNPYLIRLQIENFLRLAERSKALDLRLIFINDSPGDEQVTNLLVEAEKELEAHYDIKVINNKINLGFVRSNNNAMSAATRELRNVLLLNSDAILTSGCIDELINVMQCDDLIAFVAPRSNNATICTLGPGNENWDTAYARFRLTHKHLPKLSYVPVVPGFCLMIRRTVLEQFGYFDPVFALGYFEENDLILRANKYGFSACMANHAFAYHFGAATFAQTSVDIQKNENIFLQRYPFFRRSLETFFRSPERRAENLIACDNQTFGRLAILIDASMLGPFNSGTSYFITRFLKQFCERGTNIDYSLYVSAEAASHHNLEIINAKLITTEESLCKTGHTFDLVLRLAQPWSVREIVATMRYGKKYFCFMLDAIAYDCQYLRTTEAEEAWKLLYILADGIFYQSDYTQSKMNLRFNQGGLVKNWVSMHSLSRTDYVQKNKEENPNGFPFQSKEFLFIAGNGFIHKDVQRCYDAVSTKFPDLAIVVLMGEDFYYTAKSYNTLVLKAGETEEFILDYCYANALSVIFPSFYEGFGFPVLHSKFNGTKIIARRNGATVEVQEKAQVEVTYFETYDELVDILSDLIGSEISSSNEDIVEKKLSSHNWMASAVEVRDILLSEASLCQISSLARREALIESICRDKIGI